MDTTYSSINSIILNLHRMLNNNQVGKDTVTNEFQAGCDIITHASGQVRTSESKEKQE